MKSMTATALIAALGLTGPLADAAEKRVCVEVILKQDPSTLARKAPTKRAPPARLPKSEPESQARGPDVTPAGHDAEEPPLPTAQAYPVAEAGERQRPVPSPEVGSSADQEVHDSELPLGQTPLVYLKRLLEHFLTHEAGFTAASNRCDEQLTVELYPLRVGWTAFARYSGSGREERIEHLYPDELSSYAERAVLALLYDQPISSTIKRDTVLRSDSMKEVQRIRGNHHFFFGLGTMVRLGRFPTAQFDETGSTADEIRAFSPMTISAGYQGKFESWSIKASFGGSIGTSLTGASHNAAGGHTDLGGDFGLTLHFLRYLNPRALTSFYLGAGATFEVLVLTMIKPAESRTPDLRTSLFSGGLDVDLLCGWEFMRASSVQFFLEGGFRLPAYVIQSENEFGGVTSWFPGIEVKLGVIF
jgi:hypothetical protein